MSLSLAKAEELIALTTKLALLVEQDVATLKDQRPAALARQEGDRSILMLQYGKATAEFKKNTATALLPAAVKLRLKTATERLHKALKDQTRLLARFRHLTEGLVKAIVDCVAARTAPAIYAKSGAIAKPQHAAHATALTLNHAV